ncbi:MAG TPA: radical SAM protein, partial [Halanaerobiales bacterium]|nr:radical SAM protein [Halanaerobiales bacterium]
MYSYPEHLDEELISLIAKEDKLCNYLDLPVQHSSNYIRELMNRKGSRQDLIKLINRIRKEIPGVALRTSLIVGFPGEREEDFSDLLDFVREIRFERLGVFKYSREENTAAANFKNQIPQKIKEERYKILMELQRKIAYNNNQRMIGKELEVIIDEFQVDLAYGRTRYDAPDVDNQVIISSRGFETGDFVNCCITEAYEYDLLGEKSNESTK